MFAIQYGNWTANRVMSDILCWRFSAADGAFGGLNDDQAGPLPPDMAWDQRPLPANSVLVAPRLTALWEVRDDSGRHRAD